MNPSIDRLRAGFINPLLIEDAVRLALEEDLGRAGDITTLATIPAAATAEAVIASRKAGVVSGLPVAATAFRIFDPRVTFAPELEDGAGLAPGAVVARISGPARSVLSAERVALNFLGRMSGIASLTATYVARVAHTKARIVCTRKTTPGLRAFEKYAVRCGGGANHRYGLDDARAHQGQPHRSRRRHCARASRRQGCGGAPREDRDRGRHARPARRGAGGGRGRRAPRQTWAPTCCAKLCAASPAAWRRKPRAE